MIKIDGQVVQKGIAIGKLLVWEKKEPRIIAGEISDVEAEMQIYNRAKEEVVEDLRSVEETAMGIVSKEQAMIFSAQEMLLEDADFEDVVRKEIVEKHHNASYAVYKASEDLAVFFSEMKDNPYMNERAADFRHLANLLIRKMQRIDEGIVLGDEPVILATVDLSPKEIISLDASKVLAIVTTKGSANSHSAILTRSLGITAIANTGISLSKRYEGTECIVDAFDGRFYLAPSAELTEKLQNKKDLYEQEQKELRQMIGQASVTKSGRSIRLYANIDCAEDAQRALKNDAEGIGLFRSEYLYLNRQNYPTEEELFLSYREVLEVMGEKEVIIRTLDIGADKWPQYFRMEDEDNPEMGLRAIRLCLSRPEIFQIQLRALFRASVYGNLGILFPMITSLEELERIRALTEKVKDDLTQEGIDFAMPRIGIMIETPAAALISDKLAEKVDFFSIGTNDLTQYTLAMDRQNASLLPFQNTHHEAVLKLIEMTVKNAHEKHLRVGICGELGADANLTEFFLDIGVDELSVSPPQILPLRKKIRSLP